MSRKKTEEVKKGRKRANTTKKGRQDIKYSKFSLSFFVSPLLTKMKKIEAKYKKKEEGEDGTSNIQKWTKLHIFTECLLRKENHLINTLVERNSSLIL